MKIKECQKTIYNMNCIVYEFIELIHSYIVEEKSKDGDKDFELLNTRKCRDGRDQDNAL